ncbi:peptidoglycan DD-metalloendopeptidase family protein [Pseudalkalibacillus sp. JSM 102089]|uniref:peptidoglycan DD-metalloendopeptidase family protein n=1 Tax=Pseudalkalibacillus sp. JSM 102089 TaxID=3229856 RepID=UPI0035269DD0
MSSNENLGALRISLGLDSAQFNQSITDINRQLKAVRSEFTATNDGTKEYAKSLEGLRARNDTLTRQMQLHRAKVTELRRQYEQSVQVKGEDDAATQRLLIQYNNAQGVLRRTQSSLERNNAAIEEQTNKAKKAEKALKNFGDGAKSIGGTLSKTLTPALGAMGIGLLKIADNADGSSARIQRVLGITGEEADKLSEKARGLWEEGWGDSVEDVEDALLNVKQNMKDINEADLVKVTGNAMYLAEIFDAEVNEVTRAGNNLMKGFGLESEEAFDLMAWGAQNGLNFSQEMFDNLSEYAPLYKNLGFSAEEYFDYLQKGSEEGVYNLDYLNDAMKEFSIVTAEGGDATTETMGELSKGTQDLFKKFENGEATVKDLHNSVIKDLNGMDDKVKANQLGVSLYGTKWEDMGVDTMLALGGITGELDNVNGAMDRSGDNVEYTFGEKAQVLFRQTQDALLPLGETLLEVAQDWLPKVTAGIEFVTEKFENMSPTMKNLTLIVGGVGLVIGPVIGAVGMFASAIGGLIPIVTSVTGFIAGAGGVTGALGVAFTALTGPVGLTIAAVAALGAGFLALDHEMDKPVLKSEIFSDKISEATQKAVGSYMKLNDDATAELNYLSSSQSTITQGIADDMVSKYKSMGDQVLTAMKENHQKQLDETQSLFDQSAILTEEEEAKRLAKLKAEQLKETEEHDKNQKRINEIWQTAADEKRGITDKEAAEIAKIQEKQRTKAVEELSKSKEEQKIILTNLKEEQSVINAETAANTVKKSVETRDKVVKEANKQYKEKVATAKTARDDLGIISADEADKIIKEAEESRDESVDAAEDMHKKVIKEAKGQAKDHADEIDWETGEVKSGWDQMWEKVDKVWGWISNLFGNDSSAKKSTSTVGGTSQYRKYAKGTKNGRHPGGRALVGEEGRELAHIPGRGITMLGQGGAEMVNLPAGSSVLPHGHTEGILKQYGFPSNTPAYATGIGDFFDTILEGPKAIFNKGVEKFGLKDNILPSWFTKVSGSPVEAIKGLAQSKIQSLIDDWGFFGGGSASGKNVFGHMTKTSSYGYRKHPITGQMKLHAGVDYGAPTGTPIYSASGGKVIFSGYGQRGSGYGGYGNVVAITDGAGFTHMYAHNSRNYVSSGQLVKTGQTIAAVGSTGDSTGPHLHYEVRKGGRPVNPGYASGGFINEEHTAQVGEGGKKEVIIPLEQYKGRAVDLWLQTGKILGMFKAPQTYQVSSVGASSSGSMSSNMIDNLVRSIQGSSSNAESQLQPITLNYYGSGSREDASDFASVVEEQLTRNMRRQNRGKGIK